ncbi:MAG: shikimate kinase [Nitrososphaerota archaeon]
MTLARMRSQRRGWARAYGAVTIINAISIWRGAAIGVDFETDAEVELTDDGKVTLVNKEEIGDDLLAKAIVDVLVERLNLESFGCRIMTRSNIPIAVGLKSSSSAAVAITLAILDALDVKLSVREFLTIVAEASRRSGTSITGAIDDASSCALGGIVITNNKKDVLIRRIDAPTYLRAVILVPPEKQFTKDFRSNLLEPIKGLVEEAFRLAVEGNYFRAMTINGLIHASALSLPTEIIIDALRAGALACSVSGTGPSFASLTTDNKLEEVCRAMSRYEGKIIVKSVNNTPATGSKIKLTNET